MQLQALAPEELSPLQFHQYGQRLDMQATAQHTDVNVGCTADYALAVSGGKGLTRR
jgi:hypothetical protein